MTVALLIVRLRRLHRWVAPFVMLPLLTSVITGTAYRVLRDWSARRDDAHWLMSVHEVNGWDRSWSLSSSFSMASAFCG